MKDINSSDALSDITKTINVNSNMLDILHVSLNDNKQAIENLRRIVVDGNGDSIMTRLRVLETKLDSLTGSVIDLKEIKDKVNDNFRRGALSVLNATIGVVGAIAFLILEKLFIH